MVRWIMVLSAALAPGGCGSIPPASLPALSRIGIATTDPAVLRVAVRLPDAVKPRPGGVTMDAVTRGNGAADRTVSLGFGIATKAFCRVAALPPGPLPATSYLMTSETGRYVILTEADDLRSRPKLRGELEGLEPC
nr:hypothetical protein [uncultured Rhodopila sp.]